MAEKKYSKEDQQKMAKDVLNDFSSKGADFKEIWPTCDGGMVESLKELKKDPHYTIDQSQEQTEQNHARYNQKKS